MGWFWGNREPRPDPVGDLCRLLVERPWEWEAFEPPDGYNGMRHVPSDVEVMWGSTRGRYPQRFVTLKLNGQLISVDDVERVRSAIRHSFIARATGKSRPFSASAVALAKAVLAGEHEAARALADEVFEHAKGV